ATLRVVMTHTAQRFVGAVTFETLTGSPVFTELFESSNTPPTRNVMPHLALADGADLIAVAPASAHCVAKLAHGLADDLLTTLVLAAECPVVVVPAMDGGMWTHPAVCANVRTLRQRGVTVLEPEVGRDRGADVVLVAGPTSFAPVPNVAYVSVVTSEEMRKEVVTRFPGTDVLIMAAAVADFRPARPAKGKVPKGRDVRTLALEP